MSSKVDSVLPSGEAVFGAWVSDAQRDGDVAVYASSIGAVIAQNRSYKDKIEFSDVALIVCPDNTIRVQYADDATGEVRNASILPEVYRMLVLEMLTRAKTIAKDKSP